MKPAYEELAGRFLTDPWGARDDYIDVIVDRSPDLISKFLKRHATRPFDSGDEIKILELMELQRHAMLMYTVVVGFLTSFPGLRRFRLCSMLAEFFSWPTSFLAAPSNLNFSNVLNLPRATYLNTGTAAQFMRNSSGPPCST